MLRSQDERKMSSTKENRSEDSPMMIASGSMPQLSVFSKPKPHEAGRRTASTTPGRVTTHRKPLQRVPGSYDNQSPRTPSQDRSDLVLGARKLTPGKLNNVKVPLPDDETNERELDDPNENKSRIEIARLGRQIKDHQSEIKLVRDELNISEDAKRDTELKLSASQKEIQVKLKSLNEAQAARKVAESRANDLQADLEDSEMKLNRLRENQQKDAQILRDRELENRQLNDQLEKALEEKEKAERKEKDLLKEFQRLEAFALANQETLQERERHLRDSHEELKRLKSALLSSEERIQELTGPDGIEEQLVALRIEHSQAQSELQKSEDRASVLEEKVRSTIKETAEAWKGHGKVKEMLEDHMNKLQAANDRIAAQEQDLLTARVDIEDITARLHDHEKTLEEVERLNGLKEQFLALQSEHEHLREVLEQARSTEERLRAEKGTLEKDRTSLEEEIHRLEHRLKEAEGRETFLQKKLEENELSLQDRNKEIDHYKLKSSDLERELQSMHGPGGPIEQLSKLQSEHQATEQALEEKERERVQAAETCVALQTEKIKLSGENADLKCRLDESQETVKQLRQEVTSRMLSLNTASQEITDLKSELEASHTAFLDLQHVHEQDSDVIETLRADLACLQTSCDLAEKNSISLKEAIEILRQDLAEAALEKEGLSDKLEHVGRALEDAQIQASQREDDLKTSRAEAQRWREALLKAEIALDEFQGPSGPAEALRAMNVAYQEALTQLKQASTREQNLSERCESTHATVNNLMRENEVLVKRMQQLTETLEKWKDSPHPLKRSKAAGASRMSMKLSKKDFESGNEDFCKMPHSEDISGTLLKHCRFGYRKDRFVWVTPYQPFVFWSQEQGKGAVRRSLVEGAWHDRNEVHVTGGRDLTFIANSETDAERWSKTLRAAALFREIPHPGGDFNLERHGRNKLPTKYSSRSLSKKDDQKSN